MGCLMSLSSNSSIFFDVNKKLINCAYGTEDNCSEWLIMFSNLWLISNQYQKKILLSSAIKALEYERLL
jgi:hypothetical protein